MKVLEIYNKIGLLPRIIIAIVLGVLLSYVSTNWIAAIFATFGEIFASFLKFIVPLIILGLVAPGISSIGSVAGRLLAITVAIAYGSTLFAGFFSYFTCSITYPYILSPSGVSSLMGAEGHTIDPLFTIAMPPTMDVMSALVISFILGVGSSAIKGDTLKNLLEDFKDIIIWVIEKIIIPLLPLYIFSIFLKMGVEGRVTSILSLFVNVIVVIFVMHIFLLLLQFVIAGAVAKRNPFKLMRNMLPAYMTALGTQSSAATIPITLEAVKRNGVDNSIAAFVVPLCATVHLAGSILKIVACAFAIMYMNDMDITFVGYSEFILLLGVTMVAAPGVPGGAIMAALGLLHSVLGFDDTLQAIMIALYITMDSFGTACNVMGDGAISVVVNKIYTKK